MVTDVYDLLTYREAIQLRSKKIEAFYLFSSLCLFGRSLPSDVLAVDSHKPEVPEVLVRRWPLNLMQVNLMFPRTVPWMSMHELRDTP